MNKLYFLIFILIFSLVYLGIHYYVYSRIVAGLSISVCARSYLRIFFLIAALSFVLGEFLSRYISVYPVVYLGNVWFGIISIALSIFIVKDILGLLRCFATRNDKLLTYSAIILVILLSGYALYNAAQKPKLREVKITHRKITKELSGFTIIQLSDLHLSVLKSAQWLGSIVDRVNGLNPDLIVITGDLMDSESKGTGEICEALKNLKAKYGVFGITGNHEYYFGIDKFMEIAKKSNINILRNDKITIANDIELIGIDDDTGKQYQETGSDLKKIMQNCDFKKMIILLAHSPVGFGTAVDLGIDLQLSGHTHRGQIPPMNFLVYLYYKYPYGLYKKSSSYIYTTSGTGTWAIPMRLFSRSEIVKITLQNDK